MVWISWRSLLWTKSWSFVSIKDILSRNTEAVWKESNFFLHKKTLFLISLNINDQLSKISFEEFQRISDDKVHQILSVCRGYVYFIKEFPRSTLKFRTQAYVCQTIVLCELVDNSLTNATTPMSFKLCETKNGWTWIWTWTWMEHSYWFKLEFTFAKIKFEIMALVGFT